MLIKESILSIICTGELTWTIELQRILPLESRLELLQMEQEGLIEVSEEGLKVTEFGKAFVRNICMVFDCRYHEMKYQKEQIFSKAI